LNASSRIKPSETGFEKAKHGGTGPSGQVRCFFLRCYRNPECGYPASSIRERIYAGSYGYGILLYTGSPDAEGTMGGLVQAGRQIARHLKSAIDLGRLCSNDPVCAQHAPENQHECRFLHGAACHGCLLIAETSCEQHNDFLDRALVISTVDSIGAEFFGENEV
jgi:MrfA Zn-binding domain